MNLSSANGPKIAGIVFIIYLGLGMITVLRSYIEIVQVWMFPRLQTFWFALVFLFLVLYVVTGGFQVLTGMAFISSVLSVYVFYFLFALPYANFANLLPILDHSFTDLLKEAAPWHFRLPVLNSFCFIILFSKSRKKCKMGPAGHRGLHRPLFVFDGDHLRLLSEAQIQNISFVDNMENY